MTSQEQVPNENQIDDADHLAAICLLRAHDFVSNHMGPQTPAERIQREATFALIMGKFLK